MAITGQCKRRRIVINADAYISGATSNVPVLVKFNSTSHPDLFATGDDGDSVWFSSDAGGQTTLYHEGVLFDATNAHFYVKVDLSSTADTVIYFWYGTPSITGTESKTGVWANGLAIYHFEGNGNDSSSNANNLTGTNISSGDYEASKVGNGVNLDASTEYFTLSSEISLGNTWTCLAWVQTHNDGVVFGGNNLYIAPMVFSYYASKYVIWSIPQSDAGYYWDCGGDWSNYKFAVVRRNSSTLSDINAYLNAVSLGSGTASGTISSKAEAIYYIGRRSATSPFYKEGILDECWVFSDAKSADFIKVVYNNVANYSTFVTIDGAVTIGSSPKQVYPVWEVQSGTAYQDTVEFTANASTTATATLTDVETVSFTSNFYCKREGNVEVEPIEDFLYALKITLNADTYISSSTSDVPILIKFNSTDNPELFDGDDGDSVRFTSDEEGTTQLPHECILFNSTDAHFYVKVDLSSSIDTTIYFFYGDTDNTGEENKSGVWENAEAIWHFLESGSTISDSSGNSKTLTKTGSPTHVTNDSLLYGGYKDFTDSDYFNSGALAYLNQNAASNNYGTAFLLFKVIDYESLSTAKTLLSKQSSSYVGTLFEFLCYSNLIFPNIEVTIHNYRWFKDYTSTHQYYTYHSDIVAFQISPKISNWSYGISGSTIYFHTTNLEEDFSGSYSSDGSIRVGNFAGSSGKAIGETLVYRLWIFTDTKSLDWEKAVLNNVKNYSSFVSIGSSTSGMVDDVSVKFILTHEATETVTFAATAAKTDVEVIEFTVNVSSEVIDLDEVVPFTANYSFTIEAILSQTQTIEFTETATFAAIKEVTDVELVEFGVTATATVLPTQLSSLIEFTETATFAAAKTTIDVEVIEFAANVSMDVFEGEGTQDLVEFAVNPSFEVIAVFEHVKTVEFSGIYGLITPSLALNLTPIEFQEVASFKVMDVELIKFSATVTFEAAKTVTDIEVIEFSAVFTPSVTEMDEILNFTVTATPSVTAVLTDIELIEFTATSTFETGKPLIDVEVIEFSATFTPDIETYQAELIEFTVTATPKEVVNFPSPYPDWKYRKSKEIIGSNNALTDYQMKLTLHYGSGTDDDDNVYLNSHSKTDFSDIRFSHDSGALDYFIEDKVDEDYAIVWIEIDSISTSGETIYIYYGNISASDESSGENTFVDFAGSSITSYSETPNLDPSGKFRYRARLERYSAPVGNPYDTYFGLKNTDGSQYLKFQLMWDTSLHRVRYWAKRTAEWAASPVSLDSDTIQKFTLIKNEDGVYFYSDNGGTYALIEYWYTNYIPNATLGLFYYDNEEYLGITWAFLAKYTDTEPTFSTTGEEEQSGLTDRDNIDLFWILSTLEITVAATTSFEINSWSILIEFTVTATFESHYPIFDVELIEFSATFETKISYAKIYVDLDELKVESISVNKSIQDATWNCDITIDGTETISFFRHVTVEIPDHNSVSRVVFVGFIPTSNHILASVTNKSKATAYDYSWYLSVQQVPDEYLITNAEPSTIILALLGGEDWETVTGINPYQLIEVENWGTITKTFIWDRKTTKHQAIQEICEYIGYIFLIKWKLISGFYYPIAYFVPKDDIDTYLDLPSPITITSGVSDQHVIEGISIENTQVESVNRVIVKGIDAATGTYYSSVKESLSVTDKEEIPIEIYYESADLNTQEKADDKAEEIYNLLQEFPKTYDVQLINRTDLELYQKIKFVGYSQIDEVYYRIISINYSKIGINTKVSIKLAKDDDLSNLANILRNNSGDFTNNITKIVDSRLDSMPTVAIGRILAINGSVATVELEDGSGNIEARLLNQT